MAYGSELALRVDTDHQCAGGRRIGVVGRTARGDQGEPLGAGCYGRELGPQSQFGHSRRRVLDRPVHARLVEEGRVLDLDRGR